MYVMIMEVFNLNDKIKIDIFSEKKCWESKIF